MSGRLVLVVLVVVSLATELFASFDYFTFPTPMSQCPLGTSWTLWFDRDDPYGRCDCETLGDLRRENRGRICERPVGIEARNSHTKQLYTGNRQNIKISPTLGFTCWNTRNYRCRDHEVRFCCPTRRQCRRPNNPRNGEVVSKNGNQDLFDADQKVWFRCDRGFKLDGHKDFECQDDGSWEPQPFPRCVPERRQCRRPNDPRNGEVESKNGNQDSFDPDQKVWFKCDRGFKLDGHKDFECQDDGSWEPQPFPRCVPERRQCRRPNDPRNGEVESKNGNQDLFDPDQKVWFRCDRGFKLDGHKDFECQNDGSWEPQPFPTCVPNRRQCRRPNDPRNGEVESKNGNQDLFDPDQKVWFRCDRGFKLDGHKDFECQNDGSWEPQPFPICVPNRRQCRRPNDPRNGEVVSKNGNQDLFDSDQKVWFRCDRGFKLDGQKDFECQDDGSWKPQPFPRCVPDRRQCRRPNDPRNGEVESKNGNQDLFDPDQKVWFRCDRGFKLDGHKDFECQNDGSWEPQPFPTCVPNRRQCRRPNDPRNGEVESKNGNQDLFDPNQKVWFRCDRGFKLDGHKDFECQDDRSWEPQPFPKCVPERTGNTNQQTVVACERDFRKVVRCPKRYKIQFISGFYGRDDRQTCPHKSIHTDRCFAKGSLEKLRHQCNNRSSCRLLPSNNSFGDPCPGTYKYIEITYYCKKR